MGREKRQRIWYQCVRGWKGAVDNHIVSLREGGREGRVSMKGEIPEDYQLLDLHQVGVGYDMLQYLYMYEHTWKYIRDTGWQKIPILPMLSLNGGYRLGI